MKRIANLWLGILILIILSPLGLILPYYFKLGKGWGEWNKEEIKNLAGYIPEGLAKLINIWQAPFSDYTFFNYKNNLGYIISALLGVFIVTGAVFLLAKFLVKNKDNHGQ